MFTVQPWHDKTKQKKTHWYPLTTAQRGQRLQGELQSLWEKSVVMSLRKPRTINFTGTGTASATLTNLALVSVEHSQSSTTKELDVMCVLHERVDHGFRDLRIGGVLLQKLFELLLSHGEHNLLITNSAHATYDLQLCLVLVHPLQPHIAFCIGLHIRQCARERQSAMLIHEQLQCLEERVEHRIWAFRV